MLIPSYKPAYHYGGPVRSVAALCESLVMAGHEVSVYTTNANGDVDLDIDTKRYYSIDGVTVRYFKRWTKGHSNFSPVLFWEFFRKARRFDVIHIHSWWNPIAIFSVFICWFLNLVPMLSPRGSVTAYSFENRNTSIKNWFHRIVGRVLLKHTILHVTSSEEKREIDLFVAPSKPVYVLPNILELPKKVYGEPAENGVFTLIFLSRIDPKKNLELLIKVLSGINTIPIRLLIVGKGERSYELELRALDTGKHEVVWLGNMDGEERFKLLAESDLFVLPSFSENYGNVVLEALSQGTPVLISEDVGAKDFVIEHNLGWIVERSESAMRSALEGIWKDTGRRENIRKIAPGLVAKAFDSSEKVKEYIAMYVLHTNKSYLYEE
jgi:glycosyltransferase involved in cell wall biosynthesis